MKLGLISKYKVERETHLGYTISDESGEYFLHHNECNHQKFKEGDIVEAFLYTDKQRRIAATCYMPYITLDQGGLCEVVNRTETGAYVNIGISRDLLLSSDDLPRKMMPKIGDKVACKIRIKNNNLYIKLLTKQNIIELQDNTKLNLKDKVNGYVYRITDDGLNFIDEHYNIIFVHKSNTKKEYRVGEYINGRIININQNFENEYTATTIEQKELVLEDDKKTIMDYIDSHFGVIPFSENTTPEVIERVFKMSKAAFKRAIGSLYKDKLIIIEEERIISSKMINWSNTFNKK